MNIESVMVVDDSRVQNDFALNLCQQLLAEANIFSSGNGRDALETLRKHPVSILLVDLEMPIMDGVELLAYVTAEKLAQAAIVLSSKDVSLISAVGTMAEAQGIKVLATIKKPITQEVLTEALQKFEQMEICASVPLSQQFSISEQDLATGIENRQFLCHFQPKLTTKSIMVKGVESLARWQHPEYGFVPPQIFIDIAEKAGLINQLTYYLFETSLFHKQKWQMRGLNFGLAFNLSPFSLSDKNIVSEVQQRVKSYGVSPKDITLEITENALLRDLGQSLQTLARFRLSGFNIAIDDYGTGFANAEQLSLIPATELKLDRSIVDGSSSKLQLAKILESTVRLAKDLNMTTVAEGVENVKDYNFMAEIDVDLIQGYFFSRPLDPETLVNWIGSDLKVLRSQIKNNQV